METTSLCLMLCLIPAAARLDIRPNAAQIFQYTEISLRCVEDSSGWTLTRNTSNRAFETGFGISTGSSCTIEDAYPWDTGVYWCQSPQNEVSDTVSITVKVSGLILEVPALPVMEGDNVTLRCSYREKGKEGSSSAFNAAFYQDQVFKGNEPAGVKTLSPVTKDHVGLYMCQHPTFGKSPESFLTVTAVPLPVQSSPGPGPDPDSPVMTLPKLLCSVALFVLYTVILIICIYMYRKWARDNVDREEPASLPDVTLNFKLKTTRNRPAGVTETRRDRIKKSLVPDIVSGLKDEQLKFTFDFIARHCPRHWTRHWTRDTALDYKLYSPRLHHGALTVTFCR
ncbi:uncharacterized protein V6R79_006055 [Siganus canaliculatus]